MRSIATYPLAALCGLAMVVSVFLKWVKVPSEISGLFGGGQVSLDGGELSIGAGAQSSFGPMDLLDFGFSVETLLQDPAGIAIAASFVFAAAVAILGFLGGTVPRIFAILGGLLPFGIVGYGYFSAQDQAAALPIPSLGDLTSGDGGIMEAINGLTPFLDVGIYAYFGGAFVLLLLGLFSPAKRESF